MPLPKTAFEFTQNSHVTGTINKGCVHGNIQGNLFSLERTKSFDLQVGESSPGVATICIHKMADMARKNLQESLLDISVQAPLTGEVSRVQRQWVGDGWEMGIPQELFL